MNTSGPALVRLDARTLKALSIRQNALGARRSAAHVLVLVGTGALVLASLGSWWMVAAVVAHGYVLNFLFCPLHEATHQTPFRSRWLGGALGHACGFALLLPFGYFRLFHWDHHRYTQDPLRDPELARGKPASFGGYLLHVSGLPNWKARLTTVGRHALTGQAPQSWVAPEQRAMVVREARVYLVIYAVLIAGSIALQSAALIWLWLLPAIVGQIFLRNYLLAEHTGCAHSRDVYADTRTVYTNPLTRFLAWNMPYHAAHHAYPSVPFHALPRLNALLAPNLLVVEHGYIAIVQTMLRHLVRQRSATVASET